MVLALNGVEGIKAYKEWLFSCGCELNDVIVAASLVPKNRK